MRLKNQLQIGMFISSLMIPFLSFSQWTSNLNLNTPVCTEINNQKDMSIVSDTKGGIFIIWTDKRNSLLKADIYAQRLNAFGIEMWNHQGVDVCVTSADKANPSTVEDGNGGVIIAWDDSLNNDRDIYAQKLDSSGNPLWLTNGSPVVVKASKQKDVKIISDGAGGAIAVWEDSLAGYWDIYAQRISENGTLLWTATGVPVCTAVLNQKNPRLVSDGFGGAYIVWQDKRGGIDYDIYAQHLNASGNAVWATDGIAICSLIEKQTDPKIVSDGLGGAIITWQDKRSGIAYDVYAQRVNSSGVLQWTANGNAVCTADSSQTSVDLTSENIYGAIITWRDKRNGLYHDIYTQKMNLNGTVAWQNNGISITTDVFAQTEPNICGDGHGGAIIVWQDSSLYNWNIKSQRVNSSGVIEWNLNGNIVSEANNEQVNPKNISDGKGGSIYVWKDFRNGIDDDIYAQHLSALGAESVFNSDFNLFPDMYIYPNPVRDIANIKFNFEKDISKIWNGVIFDVIGKEIMEVEIKGSDSYFNINEVNNGIYFFKIMDGLKTISITKFIIEK